MNNKVRKTLKVLYNMSSIFALFLGLSGNHLYKKEFTWYWIAMFTIGIIYTVWFIYTLVNKKYSDKFV